MMVFDEALYKFALNSEVEFLTWRTWISFWVAIIALTVACFQGSCVVKFFTSFTKDIFAMFIASIYIAEAIHNTIEVKLLLMLLLMLWGRTDPPKDDSPPWGANQLKLYVHMLNTKKF